MRKCSQMPYHTGLRLRIYPSAQQKEQITKNAGAQRFAYNRLVALNNERYRLIQTAAFVPQDKQRLEYIDGVLRNPDTALPAALKNSAPFLYEKDIDSFTKTSAGKPLRKL